MIHQNDDHQYQPNSFFLTHSPTISQAPLFQEDQSSMKLGMDIFCSSPASTAVSSGSLSRSPTQKPHQSSSSSITPRLIRALSTPCSSSSDHALNPKLVSYTQLRKQPTSGRKSTTTISCCGAATDRGDAVVVVMGDEQLRRKRRSSADAGDDHHKLKPSAQASSSKCIIVPDKRPLFDQVSNSKTTKISSEALLVVSAGCEDQHVKRERRRSSGRPPLAILSSRSSGDEIDDSAKLKSSSSSSASSSKSRYHCSTDKVVVLRVSLHCKGCEAKVRKHISKMEGVKSYNTDLATKRVTVISNMDPNHVLASVSKVKYAQFWPASSSSQHYFTSPSTSSSPSAALLTLTR